jgi:hypothetical protein
MLVGTRRNGDADRLQLERSRNRREADGSERDRHEGEHGYP